MTGQTYYKNQIAHLTEPGRYRVADNLFLFVTKAGSRSWVMRMNVNGERKEKGLGGYPSVSLDEAKEKALSIRLQVRMGEPIGNEAPTFEQAAMETIEEKRLSWKDEDKTSREWIASLQNHVFPKLGNRKVTELIGKDFYNVLMPLWSEKKFDMGDVIRKRMSVIMAWACVQGYIQFNPVQNIKTPKNGNGTKHFKALHYSAMGNLLTQVKATKARPMTKALVEFQMLTACRPSEARLATWNEIDLESKIWTIPADKMKMGLEHRIPLSERAIEILHEIASESPQNGSGLIFSLKGKALNRSIVTSLLKEHDVDSTAHGFRSAFRSWCADTQVAFDVAEKCLAHVPNLTVRAYDRSDCLDQRRGIMEAWGTYLNLTKAGELE